MRRWWRGIGLASQLTIVGLMVAILGLVPSYVALLDNRGTEGSSPAATPASALPGATNTSLRQPSGQNRVLQLDAAYNRTPDSIMWALSRALPAEDDRVIQAPNLPGNEPAQRKIADLLARRGGVKIEVDDTETGREHSQVRLVVTGQHEGPVLITDLRANVLRREPPLSRAIVFGPPQGGGENVQVGLDLDSLTPSARGFDERLFLAGPYFTAHHVSVNHGEQVVFLVRAFTSKCYCEWELLVSAVVDGKEQVFSVRDGDRPFRTTAFARAYKTIYGFDFERENRFVKLPPGTRFPPTEASP